MSGRMSPQAGRLKMRPVDRGRARLFLRSEKGLDRMRWWLRILVTLVLAPILWQLATSYLGSTQGGSPDALAQAALASLPKIYLIYTLPALAVVVLCLVADRILARLGLDLLIVAVAPAVAQLGPDQFRHICGPDRPRRSDETMSIAAPVAASWPIRL